MATQREPRRTPADADRRRDPERTRARILAAAVEEFGAYGYTGGRVSRIAEAAGLNAQLISYHFGGKAGLYHAVRHQWRKVNEAIPQPDVAIGDIAAGFVRSNAEHPAFARMLAWEGLGDAPDAEDDPDAAASQRGRAAFYKGTVADIRRRQDAGELPADAEPAHLLLALFAMARAPFVLPQIVELIAGADADSDQFAEVYAEQVAKLVRHWSS